MTASLSLDHLRRPKLLVRAARHGLSDYSRERDLRRIIGGTTTPVPARAAARLLDLEEQHEQCRRAGDGLYRPSKHIEVLVALMAESKLSAAAPAPRLSKKSLPLGWRVVDTRPTHR